MFGNSNIYDTAMYLIMTGQTDANKGVVAKIYNSGRNLFVCRIDIWYEIKSYISIYIPYYNFNENEHTDKYLKLIFNMSRAIRFRNDVYISASSITYQRTRLDAMLNYNTTETFIGMFNGYKMYRKIVLVNLSVDGSGNNIISTGIDKNVWYRNIYGMIHDSTDTIYFPINMVRPAMGLAYSIGAFIDSNNNLNIETGISRKGYSGYVILEYIKH